MYLPGDAYYAEFVTSDPASGALRDADSTPTATATHNGSDDGAFALAVTKLSTGRYKVTGQVPGGYAARSAFQVSVAATVGGVAGGAVIDARVVGDKAGYLLAAAGLDQVVAEPAAGSAPAINARQALALVLDAVASILTGAGPGGGTITIANPGGTATRISGTFDNAGNRTTVTLTPPA